MILARLCAIEAIVTTRGLLAWQSQPERLWVEALPEGKSYVRRLAAKHRYVCPILGGDLKPGAPGKAPALLINYFGQGAIFTVPGSPAMPRANSHGYPRQPAPRARAP